MKCQKNKEMWIVILSVLLLFLVVSGACSQASDDHLEVEAPYGPEECKGKEYEAVKATFQAAGFTDVSERAMKDLEISEAAQHGLVEAITINGKTNYDAGTGFEKSAKVVIKYHTYKCANVPVSPDEAKYIEAEDLVAAFEDAGFAKVMVEEVKDIDPDKSEKGFENEVYVRDKKVFNKIEKYPIDTEIRIVTHKTYEKYTLKISVDFVSNLLFSKYDVGITVNGNTETLEHGQDGEFVYRLQPGEYLLTFYSKENRSVSEEVEIQVTSDTEVGYKIRCRKDELAVERM